VILDVTIAGLYLQRTMKSPSIHVRIDEAKLSRLRALAAQERRSIAFMAMLGIEQLLDRADEGDPAIGALPEVDDPEPERGELLTAFRKVSMSASLVARIGEYQRRSHAKSESLAIRRLLDAGLRLDEAKVTR
jgi:hypothetical protein